MLMEERVVSEDLSLVGGKVTVREFYSLPFEEFWDLTSVCPENWDLL